MHKRSASPLDRARSQAALEAARELARLRININERIDVFEAIERAGIWLMFQPLGHLFGGYERVDDAAGIIINVKHPLSLQRFTAAHELGHYVLRHDSTLDDAERIEQTKPQDNLTEVAAHTFAAHFLMPPKLVNTMLQRLGLPLRPGQLTPRQVYGLALEFGVSYRAAVTHLAALGVITQQAAIPLLRDWEPKQIKEEIGRGTRPLDAWADVWLLNERDTGRLVYPRVNDELHITLPEMPSTGYVWTIAEPHVVDGRETPSTDETTPDGYVALVSNQFESRSDAGPGGRLGAGGTRHVVLRVLQPGRYTLRLAQQRPWMPASPAKKTFELTLDTSPVGDTRRLHGLSDRQKPLIALVT